MSIIIDRLAKCYQYNLNGLDIVPDDDGANRINKDLLLTWQQYRQILH